MKYTNGIGYVNLMFRANEIPRKLVPCLGLLKAVLGNVDTEHLEPAVKGLKTIHQPGRITAEICLPVTEFKIFTETREVVREYSVSAEEGTEDKTYLSYT